SRIGEVSVSDQTSEAAAEWDAFMRLPAAYVGASRLNDCFDGYLGVQLSERLKQARRLHDRVSAIIIDRYHLADAHVAVLPDDRDRTIALSSAERLGELGRRAGAIYWASTIASVILAAHVRVLQEQLGESLYSLALAHQELSGPKQPLEP